MLWTLSYKFRCLHNTVGEIIMLDKDTEVTPVLMNFGCCCDGGASPHTPDCALRMLNIIEGVPSASFRGGWVVATGSPGVDLLKQKAKHRYRAGDDNNRTLSTGPYNEVSGENYIAYCQRV